MPTYEYRCHDCGREFEVFQRMSDQPGVPCPDCGRRAQRLISGGAGFLFKGDGFYITDHRSEDYHRKAREEAGVGAERKAGEKPGKEGAEASSGEAGPSADARTGPGKRGAGPREGFAGSGRFRPAGTRWQGCARRLSAGFRGQDCGGRGRLTRMFAQRISDALREAAADLGVPGARFRLDRPKDAGHGDLASNIALTLASRLRRRPRDIAIDLKGRLDGVEGIERIEVAGPGFLNFFLESAAVGGTLHRILAAGSDYGRNQDGGGRRIMVEFVSANPTGPLHLGHGRQAALGDVFASLLEWSGWHVHREFYFNDAGGQIARLAESVRARYRQLLGHDDPIPEGGYHGEYVVEIASAFLEREGDRYEHDRAAAALEAMRGFAVDLLRDEQKRDLDDFNVRFDEYYPESSLYSDGRVEDTLRALDDTGLTYRRDGAAWLRTTEFGDQKDRVMVKSDGSATYFLPDVAYHMSKWERGFHEVINVQGSDHHGTVDRVRAGLRALGRPAGYPEYVLHQMVTIERGGEEVRFSKRAGSYTTLAELVAEVGRDVARYFFLMRRPEAHLVFDLDLALDQSDKNPVYKVKYAHARLCRLSWLARRKGWDGMDGQEAPEADTTLLSAPAERELINQLGEFPDFLRRAASGRAPHILCDHLERTAGLVNSWYQAGHPTRSPQLAALVEDDEPLRNARLTLAVAARTVLHNGLNVLGIEAPEQMVRGD